MFGQHGCGDFTQTHTFGFVKKGFQWYFKVGGKILNETITDPDLNDLLNNNSKVKFVIGADNAYKLTDIKLMDNDYSTWFASSGEPAISENADGTYKFTGNGEIASSEFYNLADYELAFQSAPSGGKGLRVGVSKFDDEGTLLQKALYLQIGDGNCEIGWFGDEGYVAGITTAVISSEQQHSFGVKKRGDIYYPVIDGTTVFFPQTDEWQKRQLEFSDFVKSQDGILGFTFSSENGLDLDRVELRACGEDWVKHKCYGPEGSNITILGNADGYTLSAEGTASFLTMDTYDLSTEIRIPKRKSACKCRSFRIWS